MKLNRHQVYALDELFNSYDEGEIDHDEIDIEPHALASAGYSVTYQLSKSDAPVSARLNTIGELTPAPGQED